jgi:aldose 1-epimerase
MTKIIAAVLISYIAAIPVTHAATPHAIFGAAGDQSVEIYTLRNAQGVEARIMTYGATLVSLKTPDRSGKLENIVLGFDTLQPYLDGVPYFGATVGRYANRIAHGKFSIDGGSFQLPLNDGANSLHGGTRGFDKLIWNVESGGDHSSLRLSLKSPAGDQGYPGELTVHVTYRLLQRSLAIEFQATTTAATPVNLANHTYFNLGGDTSRTILKHTLQINADKFTPVDATLIPTGELRQVAGSVFDFRKPHAIGERIDVADEQLKFGKGYDHNWVLKRSSAHGIETVAILTEPDSGRTLQLQTTQPGLQFYSGNFLDGKPPGSGSGFQYRTGLCLETQHFPDSPNQPAFPSTILRPGHVYTEKTVLVFGIAKAHRSAT